LPHLPPSFRQRTLALVLGVLVLIPTVLGAPAMAAAAEVLQVRDATLLQVGDSNRSYSVELACVAVEPGERDAAIAWLREQLPRRSRVNLRPIGNHDGILLARVQKLGDANDLGSGLITAGLASPTPLANGCPA
jgi:hypothetical protein